MQPRLQVYGQIFVLHPSSVIRSVFGLPQSIEFWCCQPHPQQHAYTLSFLQAISTPFVCDGQQLNLLRSATAVWRHQGTWHQHVGHTYHTLNNSPEPFTFKFELFLGLIHVSLCKWLEHHLLEWLIKTLLTLRKPLFYRSDSKIFFKTLA